MGIGPDGAFALTSLGHAQAAALSLDATLMAELVQRTAPGVPVELEEAPSGPGRPQGLARHGFVSLAASILIQLINMVSGVLIARFFGPVGRGELTAVLLWPTTMATVGSLGTATATAYFASREPDRVREISATALLLAALQAAVVMGAGYVLLPVLLAHYGSDVVRASRLYLLWVPLAFLSWVGADVLRGRLAMTAFNVIRVVVVLAGLAGLVMLFVIHHLTVMSIVLVYIGANVLTLAVTLRLLGVHGSLGLRLRTGWAKPILTYGLKSHAGTMSLLVNTRADQVLISLFLLPAYLGFYSVAVSVTSPVILLGTSIALVVLPAIGRCASLDEMKIYFARFVRTALVLSLGSVLFLMLIASPLISALFGPVFAPATMPARILLLAAGLMGLNRVLTAGLGAFDKPLIPSVAQLLSTIAIALAMAALLPLYGIVGAAIAAALGYAVATAYMVGYAIRRLRVPTTSLVPNLSDLAWLWSTTAGRMARRRSGRE